MRIKKLEISGFKSFADRARLNFGDGITGVVGPNGCGKSNVVDAIRWVMGEMSAKHLRGRAMQDVIFAGSQNRNAQGMAEVTLTFDNDGHVPANYLNFSEIAVTRRLFRDGTSEYLINKAPVRLRDVTDLFLGTGVGTRAYSIIEQGRIGFVVNSRPEERRSLIEEVAGITKFKVRKKAAERRMEATEQNLARVCDVVGELERQLVTLRKQARKAERYREMRQTLQDIELHRAVLDFLRLQVTYNVQVKEVQRLAAAISDNQRDTAAEESQLEAARLALIESEHALTALQADSSAKDAAVAGLERDIAHWRAQQGHIVQAGDRARDDAQEAEQRMQACREEYAQLQQEAETLQAGSADDHGALRDAEDRVADGEEQLATVDEELEALREAAMQRMQGAAQRRAETSVLERQRLDDEMALVRAQEEEERLQPLHAAAQAREAELLAQRQQEEHKAEAAQARQAELVEVAPALKLQARQGAEELQQLRDALGQSRSRLSSLEAIVSRLDGYSDGVRHLCGGPEDAPKMAGILALVAEVLEVDSAHERAIEAVLGDRLQYLLVEDEATAARAIAELTCVQGGRGGFIPAAVAPAVAAPTGALPTGPGIIGPAQTAVTCTSHATGLVGYLLGHVILVDTLQTAQAARSKHPGYTFVTAHGDVVDGAGVAQGGADSGAGLLATRREVRDLADSVAQQDADYAEAALRQEALTARLEEAESDLAALNAELHAGQLARVTLRKDWEAASEEGLRHAARLEALAAEVAVKQAALEEKALAEDAARQAAEAAEAEQHDIADRVAEMQERRGAALSQLAHQQDALTSIRVALATAEERVAASAQAQQRLLQTIDDLQARMERAQGASSSTAADVAALAEQVAQGEHALQELVSAARQSQQTFAEARAHYESEQARLLEAEQLLKATRKNEHGMSDALVQARMQLQKLELEQQQLQETVLERHDLHVHTLVGAYHDRPLPTAQAIENQAELERSIKAMGAINLTAIEECAEVEARYGFLAGQRDDLQEALEALKLAITRINRASKERFKEAFDAVNGMFQKIYPRLFRGGEARLELVGSEDLLEAGVDIIAMPPGKKLQSVGLLSGGEKALTATALVFAIFLIKPSPFCVLDEVDAPLDEANVGRFNEMLREISQVSQFIVITHNKQTMLQMDRLYGITMEEPGMSKVVTVDLDDRQSDRAA